MKTEIRFNGTDAALVLTGAIDSEVRTSEAWTKAGMSSPQKNERDIFPPSILDLVPDDGKWHHVIIVSDGGKNEGYIDGSKITGSVHGE